MDITWCQSILVECIHFWDDDEGGKKKKKKKKDIGTNREFDYETVKDLYIVSKRIVPLIVPLIHSA